MSKPETDDANVPEGRREMTQGEIAEKLAMLYLELDYVKARIKYYDHYLIVPKP